MNSNHYQLFTILIGFRTASPKKNNGIGSNRFRCRKNFPTALYIYCTICNSNAPKLLLKNIPVTSESKIPMLK